MDPLKLKFKEKATAVAANVKKLNKDFGEIIVDDVRINQVIGGMRDIKSMLWETSELDAIEGIRFRGYNIPDLHKLLPKAKGGSEPLPEGLFWLMLTGEIPTQDEVNWLCDEWERRSELPKQVINTIESLSLETHPMTQFSIGILSMQSDSVFANKYREGLNKADYWDVTYEDAMNVCARIPKLAAYIYRRTYHNGNHIEPDNTLDWAGNFAHQLGYEGEDFKELMRLYLTIHADHEGGNASAHATHLVGSTLSDAYLSLSGGMNALAGPLHGLANQEVVGWITEMTDTLGTITPTKDQIANYVKETLAAGKVVPGYGHAVLRRPDPRFIAQKEFAEKNIKNAPMVQIVWDVFEVVPPILESLGKVKNPWPNVDAHSGALLIHYGLTEYNFYTVLFGVSRTLGVLASLCWSRALGLPLERPKSVSSSWLMNFVEEKNKQ